MPEANTQEVDHDITERRLADAWAELQAHSDNGNPLLADAYRLAFADPEFLLRRETRGIRLQLEMLKPDVAQQMAGINNTVVVFGSARFREPEEAAAALQAAEAAGEPRAIAKARALVRNAHYCERAREFGRIVAQYSAHCAESEKLFICTGGGPGIMEAASRGAHDEGALNVGLNIALPHEQSANPYISPPLSFKFHYFALRKMHFMMRAKAMVAFPGGFGTLDELFEVITLVQCKKSKPIPILLYGSEYWQRLLNLEVLVEEGTISPEDLQLFHYVDDPKLAWQKIVDFYQLATG
jgi:uncharacterized protein (TIGR00730 family)